MSSKNRLKKLVLPSRVQKKQDDKPILKELTLKKITQQQKEEIFECPLCFEIIKAPFPHALNRLIKTLKKNEQQYKQEQETKYNLLLKKSTEEEGIILPPFTFVKPGISKNDQKVICRMHKVELEMKPLALKRGYPTHIDFNQISSRIHTFKQDLFDIINSDLDSSFLQNVLNAFEDLGSIKARQNTAMMDRFEETLPGYYGNRGSYYIMETLNELLIKTNYMNQSKSSPLTPIEYIQQVLVPECGIRLIKQDLNLIDLQEAKKVMKESIEYGSIIYNKIKK